MTENDLNTGPCEARSMAAEFPPIPSAGCRGMQIINSDQVEFMATLHESCKFMLSIGRTHICRHPLRLNIAARAF